MLGAARKLIGLFIYFAKHLVQHDWLSSRSMATLLPPQSVLEPELEALKPTSNVIVPFVSGR